MESSDDAPLDVSHQDGNAVGSLDRQQQGWGVGDQAVARQRFAGGRIHAMHSRRVNLPDLQQRPKIAAGVGRAQRNQKRSAIALDIGLRVVRRDAEV